MSRVAVNPIAQIPGYDFSLPITKQGYDLRKNFPCQLAIQGQPRHGDAYIFQQTIFQLFALCVRVKTLKLTYSISISGVGSYSNTSTDSFVALTGNTPPLDNELDLDFMTLFQPTVTDTATGSPPFEFDNVTLYPTYDAPSKTFSIDFSEITSSPNYLQAQTDATHSSPSGVVATIFGQPFIFYVLNSNTVTGTFSIDYDSYWAYIGTDGLPIYDSLTGEQLIKPTPQGR